MLTSRNFWLLCERPSCNLPSSATTDIPCFPCDTEAIVLHATCRVSATIDIPCFSFDTEAHPLSAICCANTTIDIPCFPFDTEAHPLSAICCANTTIDIPCFPFDTEAHPLSAICCANTTITSPASPSASIRTEEHWWLKIGDEHYEAERYEEALAAYEHVLRLNPNHIEAHSSKKRDSSPPRTL